MAQCDGAEGKYGKRVIDVSSNNLKHFKHIMYLGTSLGTCN